MVMNRRRFNLVSMSAAGASGMSVMRAAAQPSSAPPESDGPHVAASLNSRAAAEGVGYAAAVVTGAGVTTAFAGRRSASDSRAPDSEVLFEYGSITKTFTALLLADMVLRREIALDGAVEEHLGQRLRDSAGDPIRWVDLATHRSGLPRLPANLQPRVPADPYADYDEAALKAFVQAWHPAVVRQARWEYSNLGYGLLGHALGQRAGRGFAALLRERVLQPLGLSEVRVATPGDADTGLLPGHDAQGNAVARWTFDALAGCGGLIGSTRSLARYAQAALGLVDTPLAGAFGLCLQQHAPAGNPANTMGLGWILGRVNGRRVANHDGGTFGFSSSLFLERDRRRAALVMANAFVAVTDLALHALDSSVPLRDAAAEQRQTRREAVTLSPLQLEPLAGQYALTPQFGITLRVRDGRLFAQASGQGEFELFALDPRRFFARVTALELHFEGDSGTPAAFVLHQSGQRLRFVRP